MPSDFFYAYPFAVFFLFAIIGFLFLFAALIRYRSAIMARFYFAIRPRSPLSYWLQVVCLMAAWWFGVVALMDPKGNPQYPEGKQKSHGSDSGMTSYRRPKEVVFLLDDSASMAIRDMRNGRSRLDNGKELVDQIIGRFEGEEAALYAFTGEADKLVPSTTDYIYLRLLLRGLEVNAGETVGTDIVKSVKTVVDDYHDHPSQAYKYLVLLSDGGDTSLYEMTKSSIDTAVAQMTSWVPALAGENWKIYTIGLGTAKGADVPDVTYQGKPVHSAMESALLQALAVKGKGAYETLEGTTATLVADKLAKAINEDSPFLTPHEAAAPATAKESITVVYDSYYHYPLLIAVIALLAALFIPDRFDRETAP